VNGLETKISIHANDLIQKYASGLFRDATLEFYGIKTAKIKELINVELPIMEVGGSAADYVFLLEDGTYLHFEFQSKYSENDLVRFAGYDVRLYERDGRRITTAIIYTADVKKAEAELNIGSMLYRPEKIMMNEYDGNVIFTELSNKITGEAEITDVDMLNLIFLPLMRNSIPRNELAINSFSLAQRIQDTTKRDACMVATFAFASRYLDEENIKGLVEVFRMTDVATMLIEDAVKDAVSGAKKNEKLDIAKKLLKRGISIEAISEDTGLEEAVIKNMQTELLAKV
jgi:hypothetical protein